MAQKKPKISQTLILFYDIMSKTIKQIKILISCPADVENIKDLIEKCCSNFNPTFSKNENIVFEVVHWKKNVSPIITGGRAQDIINLEFEDQEYDIFIGILWKKFGEKQTNGKTPTEEEYEIALNNYKEKQRPKKVKVYFKQDPFEMPKTEEDLLQMTEILRFKKQIQKEGLYAEFNEDSFLHFFYKELQGFLYDFKEPVQITSGEKFTSYELNPNHIERCFVKAEDYQKFNSITAMVLKISSLELVKKENRIIILGDAGTGKSEEIDYIAHYFSNNDGGLLPIKIKLRNYVDQDIIEFITEPYEKLKDENLLLLLDGFDEVESKNKMTLIRKILFFEEQRPNVKIVITSRKNAYNNELSSFEPYYLMNLDTEAIEKFINEIESD